MPLKPALGRQSQVELCEFKVSLIYRAERVPGQVSKLHRETLSEKAKNSPILPELQMCIYQTIYISSVQAIELNISTYIWRTPYVCFSRSLTIHSSLWHTLSFSLVIYSGSVFCCSSVTCTVLLLSSLQVYRLVFCSLSFSLSLAVHPIPSLSPTVHCMFDSDWRHHRHSASRQLSQGKVEFFL